MRSVCEPPDANVSVAGWLSQYAPLTQPQLLRLDPPESVARFTTRPCVVFIAYTGEPLASASENCRNSESLVFVLFRPAMRSHSVYGLPDGALNGTST